MPIRGSKRGQNRVVRRDEQQTLTSFCLENRFYIKIQSDKYGNSQKEREATHYCMMGKYGGVLSVAEEQYSEFLDLCAEEVRAGRPFFLSEQKSTHFAMHFDLDFLRKDKVSIHALIHLVKIFQGEMQKYYPSTTTSIETHVSEKTEMKNDKVTLNSLNRMNNDKMEELSNDQWLSIIAVADSKTIEHAGNNVIKTGVHIYFPNLIVDTDQALQMRHSILCLIEKLDEDLVDSNKEDVEKKLKGTGIKFQKLKEHWSFQSSGNSWDSVIDHQIYTKNGLRMIYAHRAVDCLTCKKEKITNKKTCHKCEGSTKLDEQRPYRPKIVLSASRKRNRVLENTLKNNLNLCIKTCSIRRKSTTPPTPGFSIYQEASKFVFEIVTKKRSNPSSTSNTQHARRRQSGIDTKDIKFNTIMNIIRKRTIPQYNDLVGRSLRKNGDGTKYFMKVKGPGDGFCMNKNGYHGGQHIWFEITQKGIVQKCFSEKMQASRIACNCYSSKPFSLTDEEIEILFDPYASGVLNPVYTKFYRNTAEGSKLAFKDFLQKRIKLQEAREQREAKPNDVSDPQQPKIQIQSPKKSKKSKKCTSDETDQSDVSTSKRINPL